VVIERYIDGLTLCAEGIYMRTVNDCVSFLRNKIFKRLLSLAILSAFSLGHIARATPARFEGNMQNACLPSGVCDSRSIDKTFATPGVTLPTRGFVSATGSFISPVGEWTVVDFDNDTVTSITTLFDPSTRVATVNRKVTEKVSAKAIAYVENLSTDLWNSKGSSTPSTDFCTDGAQEFLLFNGGGALWLRGGCPPNGIAGEMNKWAEEQLQSATKP
jgi:hypothetical protein